MGVSAFQDTSTVHACSTVMALLCIPVSKLVSFAFSTIPICPFLIQRIFHLLVYIVVAVLHGHCNYVDMYSILGMYVTYMENMCIAH